MPVIWNAEVGEATKREAAERLQRATVFFVQQLQRRLSISNPRPYLNSSKPGEYPRKRTGNAIANVRLSATSQQEIIAADYKVRAGVGEPGKYLAILELFKHRLGFIATVEDLRPLLKAMLTGKAS